MRIVQTCLLFMLLLSVNGRAQLAIGNQPLQLRNAYETAKALYAADVYAKKLPDSLKQQLLGSLIWYADLQDANGDLYGQLIEKLKPYSFLDQVRDKLSDSLIKFGKFFELDSLVIQNYASILPASLKNSITGLKRTYAIKLNEYLNQKKGYRDYTNELRSDNNALVAKKEQTIIYFDTLMRRVTDTAIYSRLRLKAADSLQQLDASIHLTNLQYDSARKSFLAQEAGFNQWKSIGLRYLKDQQDSLIGFLLKISDMPESPGRNGLSFEDALNIFNQKTLPDIQKVITEAENAYKLAFKLPSEAEMINALAIYLANRIKQESVMWFFEKITQNANRYELLNLFFPTTMKLLQGNEVYEIPNLGAQWQYALSKDFMQMPKNVLNSEWLSKRWPEASTYAAYITGVCDFAELVVKRYSYRDAIKSLYLSLPKIPATIDSVHLKPVFQDYITLLYAINTELFVIDSASRLRLLAYEDFRNMNRKEIEIMMGLLDLKYQSVFSKFFKGVKQPVAGQSLLDVERMRRLLGNLRTAIGQVEKIGTEYQEEQKRLQQNGQKDWFYSTYNIWGAVNQVFHVLNDLDTQLVRSNVSVQAKKAFGYGEQVFEIYNLVTKKNFAGAVMNALSLIDTLFYETKPGHQLTVALKDIRDDYFYASSFLKDSVLRRTDYYAKTLLFSYDSTNRSISFEKKSPVAALLFDNDRQAIQLIRKMSGFLNDAALAQNDKQLAKVVESYAMPVGSYKRKRNNWWSVDLNAFAGVYAGYEWARRQQNDTSKLSGRRGGAVWGFSVPIGISVSKTFGRKWKSGKKEFDAHNGMFPDDYVRNPDKVKIKKQHLYNRTGWTLTVTASIVDLGAPVSYRLFHSKDTTIGQSFKWSQLISPGLHIAVALPGSPFTVSTGIQYTPQLRKYQEAGKPNEQQFNTTRVYLGLMFDLPLFNFWERKHIVYRKKG
jgi:hypothetical protein